MTSKAVVKNAGVDPKLLQSLQWRSIGPFRGARVGAVAGDPINSQVFYFGASGGGVWKSVDAGTYWENVSDGFFSTAAVGAIAVADSDPNVIYAGTGDGCFQSGESHGDGVYKSTDAGKTWTNIGLSDTRHIAKIRIHPQNPDIVYVAALGHTWGDNKERGVFRTVDGGKTWEHVLFKSDKAGAVDISMDMTNPRILYASIYELLGSPWTHKSGGPDSGLHKSVDGGDTWVDISNNPGLPTGVKGKIGVAVSPAKPDRVWALIEAEDGGLFRSDNGGESWDKLTGQTNLWWRAWYYIHLFAHPTDPETCYVLSVEFFKSSDGGRSFVSLPMPHGDNHDLWIDPRNPDRMIEGNDGGATVSLNAGGTWSSIYNQPTSAFFHLTTDEQFPYRVYGTQMDNTAISVPSMTNDHAIPWSTCYPVGSSESGHIAVRPDDPNIVYAGAIGSSPGGGGNLLRYDHHTGQTRIITVWPEDQGITAGKDMKYRFQFHFPTLLSPHDPNTLLVAANIVFKSRDEGTSWEAISPDLTRNDISKMSEPAGGPIATQVVVPFNMGSIVALAESKIREGLLWAGSDDGLVNVTRDGGNTWTDVTPKDLPDWTMVHTIEPSPHDEAVAYFAATRWKLDDTKPYLYKTADYGETWSLITNGIPSHEFTRVIREDPARQGLLYAGTELGIHVSFDDGNNWQSLQLNLPVCPVHDFVIKNNDLVVATHGRAFWILDDLTPLHQIDTNTANSSVHLFKPRVSYRIAPALGFSFPVGPGRNYQFVRGWAAAFFNTRNSNGDTQRRFIDAGENPPSGVVVHYYLNEKVDSEIKLTFSDVNDNILKTFSSGDSESPIVGTKAGNNRFVWDMRCFDTSSLIGSKGITGPVVPPGVYNISLTVDGNTCSESFEIWKDPRVSALQKDLESQFSLLSAINEKISSVNNSVNSIRKIIQQVGECVERAGNDPKFKGLFEPAKELTSALSLIEAELVSLPGTSSQKPPPTRLASKLTSLISVVSSSDWVPTNQSYEVFESICLNVESQIQDLHTVVEEQLPKFSGLVKELGLAEVVTGTS